MKEFRPREAVQLLGLVAIVAVAVTLSFNGVSKVKVGILVGGIVAIAAPRAFEEFLDHWAGDDEESPE